MSSRRIDKRRASAYRFLYIDPSLLGLPVWLSLKIVDGGRKEGASYLSEEEEGRPGEADKRES